MAIKFNHVNYLYNETSPFEHQVLSDIDVSIRTGKITGIIGKSGSGKTTLIQLLNALLIPSSGNVEVLNFNIKKRMKLNNINALRSKAGLSFQFPEEQFFNQKVEDEVSFALKYFNHKDNLDKQVIDALTIVGLDNTYLDRNVFKLSSGEQRKIAIASIMVFNPKIVILDEPTVGLDYKGKKKLMSLIKKLKEQYHKTVIIVSHDVDMLNVIADDIIALDDGKVIISGSKEEVFNNTQVFNEYGLTLPRIVAFTNKVLEDKKIKLGVYTDIKDLIKDVYRNV